jgi:hypothetical protein
MRIPCHAPESKVSDRDVGYPAYQPVSPEDLAATVFEALEDDPHGFLRDRQGRPVALVDG